jgi:LacI family transcriptional regulator
VSKAPTMNDVAREAAVALKTVSRYVNGKTNIDPVLVERIQAAITRLGYRRNLAAASIRPGWTSRTLGLIISDVANPYYAALTRGVETVASANGYLLSTASSDEDGARHDRLVDRMMEQRVDGLIIVPPRRVGRPWASVPPPLPPLVFVDRPSDLAGAHTVLADNVGGARSATAVLCAAPAGRIAFVGDSLELHTMHERHTGYRLALADADVTYDRDLVSSDAHTVEEAARTVESLMHTGRIDAVFAANNRASVGSLMAFSTTGRRLPLVGFDDFEAALLSSPAVSVVSQDAQLMGSTAAGMILALLAGKEPHPASVVLPTELLLRGSELR